MKSFIAKFSAKKITDKNGKTWSYEAREVEFKQDDKGFWTHSLIGFVLQQDVIDDCKKADNWKEIRQEFFPMEGFHT